MWKDPEKWEKLREYRAANTRNVIEHVRAAVKAVKPNMPLIGCLLSDPDEAKEYGQWWAKSSTLLDYASPMNYDDMSKDETLMTQQRDILAGEQDDLPPRDRRHAGGASELDDLHLGGARCDAAKGRM